MALLLAVTTARRTPRVYEAVFAAARAGGEPVVAYFAVDPHMADRLTRHLSEDNMLDASSCETLEQAMIDEYEARGRKKLAEVVAAARTLEVACTSELARGDFIAGCLAIAQRLEVDEVFIARHPASPLGRYLFEGGIDERIEKAGFRVHVVDEAP